MQTHIQVSDVPVTYRLNVWYYYFPFWVFALWNVMPSMPFSPCSWRDPPNLSRCVRLFLGIYNCWLPVLMCSLRSNLVDPSPGLSWSELLYGKYYLSRWWCQLSRWLSSLPSVFLRLYLKFFAFVKIFFLICPLYSFSGTISKNRTRRRFTVYSLLAGMPTPRLLLYIVCQQPVLIPYAGCQLQP